MEQGPRRFGSLIEKGGRLMAKFSYTARQSGKIIQGEINANSEMEARVRLRSQGIDVLSLRTGSGPKVDVFTSLFAPKVSGKDLQVFTRQFATLVNAGIPVVDSLKILSEGLRAGPLKEASAKVKTTIEAGSSLSSAMSQSGNVFDRLYINMIQAGEEAGILDSILNRLSVYIEKSEKIKSQVKGAMVYPIVILIVASIVIIGILVFVIPKFTEFYSAAGKEPPALTMFVVSLSHSLVSYGHFYAAALIGLFFGGKTYFATEEGSKSLGRFLFKAPIIGELIQKSSVARLSRTLSTLLSSGVGLLQAIDIAAKTAGNVVVEEALLRSKESVTQGKSFHSPLLKEKNVIPEMVTQMIAIGEQSGTLDIMLSKIADFYEDEVETAVKSITSLIEPLMMVFLGGIIAVLVIAMYLPIFNMADTIGN